MHMRTRTALAGLLALFVASQLVLAALAVTGHHSHAWEAGAPAGACWMCLTVSLVAVAAVLGSARTLRDDPVSLERA